MLGWFAEAADPDAGLLSFRQVSDALGSTPWYLRVLRDEGVTARAARPAARHQPVRRRAAGAGAGGGRAARRRRRAAAARRRRAARRAARGRAAQRRLGGLDRSPPAALRRRELLRIACGDLLGLLDVGDGRPRAVRRDGRDAVGGAGDRAAQGRVRACAAPLPLRLAIIGMGRLGGLEQGYGSDADVLFVFEPLDGATSPDATAIAHEVAQELRRLLSKPASDPPLLVDADLRPEGRQGPLVRSLDSYAEYYRRWSSPWETQALLRAYPIAGDADLGRRFIETDRPAAVSRRPGSSEADLREIRRLKARMEAERLPRGRRPGDAHQARPRRARRCRVDGAAAAAASTPREVPALRTTATLEALAAAAEAGLVSDRRRERCCAPRG